MSPSPFLTHDRHPYRTMAEIPVLGTAESDKNLPEWEFQAEKYSPNMCKEKFNMF